MGFLRLAAIIACLACASCTVPRVYSLVAAAPALVASRESSTATALDPIMHRQMLEHATFARVSSGTTVVDGSKTYAITPNHQLFGARMIPPGDTVYCSGEVTYVGRNAIGVEGRMGTCWQDHNEDGAFEAVHSVGGSIQAGLYVHFSAEVSPPAPYTIVQGASQEQIEIALKFSPATETTPAQIIAVHVDGVFETPLEGLAAMIPDPTTMPAEVTINGARVLILDLSDNVLTYRMLTGFDGAPRLSAIQTD